VKVSQEYRYKDLNKIKVFVVWENLLLRFFVTRSKGEPLTLEQSYQVSLGLPWSEKV
jgi:hypothetical protein